MIENASSDSVNVPSELDANMTTQNNNSGSHELPDFLSFLSTDAQQKAFGIFVFVMAGFCEIGGGWLVWQTIRELKPWWYAFIGSILLIAYGYVATLQPITDFARVFALYGAFFILLSIIWGVLVDGFRPDLGDIIGAVIAAVGTFVMYFWPR